MSKGQRIWSLLVPCEIYTHLVKTLTKLTTQSCFAKQPNFLNDFLLCKLWKRIDFHLYTETIPFSRKFKDQMLNCFYHYLIPFATEDKINLFNKIQQYSLLSKYIVSKRNRKIIIYRKIPKIKPLPPVSKPMHFLILFLSVIYVPPNICPWNTFYTFYSLKLGKSTSRGNKNKVVICVYLYIYVPLL